MHQCGQQINCPKNPPFKEDYGGKNTLLPCYVIRRQCKFNSNEAKGTPSTYIPYFPLWKAKLLLRPKFKEVLRVKETIMRDRLGPECFICCKQVKGIEWLFFWDFWGACLPSTTTLGPEKRVRWGAWRVNGPVLQWVTLNGHKFFNDYKLLCRPSTHTYTNTHSSTCRLHPSTSPAHWVIFT